MADWLIKTEHLCKKYPESTPLKDVNVEIRKGDVISIIGPSGTGKTTFIRCLNRLTQPSGGKIWFHDQEVTDPKCDISSIRRKMGMVFQHYQLFDNKNIIDNIACAPMDLLHMSKEEAYARAMELLEKVDLVRTAEHFPEELSGGQKQRIAICRAIAMKPEVLLFDEPTSALDPSMIGEVSSIIKDLAEEGMTIIIVTHEMKFARTIANRVFYMDEGGIYEEGSPEEIFDAPKREKTRKFIKQLQTLEIQIDTPSYDYENCVDHIYEFAAKRRFRHRRLIYLNLLFEELVAFALIQLREEFTPIRFVVEYSEKDDSIAVDVFYAGEKYDPLEHVPMETEKLIQYECSDYRHEYLNENHIFIKMKDMK